MNKQGELLRSGKRRSPGGRLLSMFLALCMIVSMLPVSAMAEEIHTTIGGSGEIISFAPLTETEKTVSPGKSGEDLELPETLTATVRTAVPADENPVQDSGSPQTATPTTSTEPQWEETTVDIPVRWVSPGYDMNTEGEYVFTPEIESYTVSAPLPEIVVTVGEMPPLAAARGLVTPMSATTYGIWVGGVQVTDANKDDVLDAANYEGATITYDPDTSTLTLDNATINAAHNGTWIDSATTAYYGIYAETALKIEMVGSNTVIGKSQSGSASIGIYTGGSLNLSGSGSLYVSGGTGKFSVGIYSTGSIAIEGGRVTAAGVAATQTSMAIASNGDITISNEGVEASADTSAPNSYGMIATNGFAINNGEVTASGKTGLHTNAAEGPVTVSDGRLTANGSLVGIAGALTVTGGTVTVKSDTKALDGSLTTSGYTGCTVTAGANKNGDGAGTYNASSLASYKYIKVEPAATPPVILIADRTALQSAIDGATGDLNLKLSDSYSGTGTITIPSTCSYNITIDLNGKTLDGGSAAAITHQGTGTLTITDSKGGGTVTSSTSSQGTIAAVGGSVELLDGTVRNSNSPGGAAIYTQNATLNIRGGAVSATGDGGVAVWDYSSSSLNIYGGTLSAAGSDGNAVYSTNAASQLNISGGTISAVSNIAIYHPNTTIQRGTTAIIQGGSRAMQSAPTLSGVQGMASINYSGSGPAPYDSVNLATYKYLKFEPAAGVSEQFNLTPGGTYYFDLSGEMGNIGTVNAALPDTTLHYVPFTYAGTVNAYSLTSAMVTTEEYANENKSDRSLFVGDYNVGLNTSWNNLNSKHLIFGKPFDTNYKLRSLSAGSSQSSSIAIPDTNEWDQILVKSGSTNNVTGWIKNWTPIASWGQDNYLYPTHRTVRGGSIAAQCGAIHASLEERGFRPTLEVLNPAALGADGLKAVTLNLNGGGLKGDGANINIICAGDSFKAPSGEGLTAPTGKTFDGWKDTSSTTTYAVGATVPNTITGLTAQWANATGAAITTAATVASALHNQITVNAAAASTNPGGQTIEYAISTNSSTAPDSGWQAGLTFISLSPSTTYYVWARTAAKAGYNAGTAVASAAITTTAVPVNAQTLFFAENTVTKTVGDPAFTNALTHSVGTGAVTYSSSNTGVATVHPTTGAVAIVGAGTTTITANAAMVPGVYAPGSASFTLTVNNAPIKTVSVGSQSGTATAGTAGSLTYAVTTANITNGIYAVSVANLPAGVTIGNGGNVTISGNSGTLTLTVADTVEAGTTGTLALTLDGATSAAFSIVIGETTPNLSATDVTLDAVTVGYMSSNYKSVVITNSGDAQATISNVTTDRPSVFSIHSGQSFVAANGSINSWQIRAATGLAVGIHTATITVTYDGGRTATATVSITVNAVGNYTVTFNPNGGTVGETTRSVASGTAVGTLPTPTRSGSYSFAGWYTAANGGTQILASTIVDANVTYYAHWTYNGGGSGSGGGSSSDDNSSPVIVTPPAPDKPNSPTQGETKVSGTVDSNGNVTVNITGKAVADVFDKAMAEAKKNGTEQNGITVVLRVDTGNKTGSSVTVNLPKFAQDTIIAKKIVNTIVVVDNPDIRIGMDLATVQEINKQAKSDVNIAATRTDSGKLTGDAKKAIGSRPVFDLKVNYGNGKAVSSFGAGSVSVTIPYTLGANENAGNVQAVYVDAKGKVHWLTNSVYDSVEKVLRFSTNHFSTYGIGYKQANTAFTDIAGHWAKEDIEFVVSRGLFSGTSETKFSPNAAMTRGMFVTVLGRLASADVSGYAKSSFSDVKSDAYYMGYIEWASKNNIVNGVGNGRFAPDQSITREQMAVIMSNYAKTIGYTLPKVHVENTFADNGKISAYAKEAVKQMQMAGVISGKNGNLFDPQGTATRAEVSAVLRRFVELAISNDTAQGWTMNDSGKWMYFKDGKPLTGKQDIDGGAYTFDQYGVTADVPKNLRYTTYIVQKGDSFWLIAHKLGCTMSELERLNNKSRFSIIYPGDVLRVPEK